MAKMRKLASDDLLKHFSVDATDKVMIEAITGSSRFRRFDYWSDSKGRRAKGYDTRLGQDWITTLEYIKKLME